MCLIVLLCCVICVVCLFVKFYFFVMLSYSFVNTFASSFDYELYSIGVLCFVDVFGIVCLLFVIL